MKSSYVCLNSKTFEIENEVETIPVDRLLASTLSILNKKGYYTEMFHRASISRAFLIGTIICELKEQELLTITTETKPIIKNIINQSDYEATLITFKEESEFDNLPIGFEFIDKTLIYKLKVLKEEDDIELKTLAQLDKENNESIKNLEKWAIDLPNKSN